MKNRIGTCRSDRLGGQPPRHIWKKKKNRQWRGRMMIDRIRHLPYPTPRAEGRMAAP